MEQNELQERIVNYMRTAAYKPLTADDLAAAMNLAQEELALFWTALEELEKTAAVIKTRHERFGVPERMNLVVGRLSMSAKGFGFIIPEVREKETDSDIFVPGVSLGGAMNGDRVVARISPSEIAGRSREGEIIRIVERANEQIVGTFEESRHFGFVTPDDKKIGQDIFIPKGAVHGAKAGMKVVVRITKWPAGRRNAEGEVEEILGRAGEPGVDVLSVMSQYGLSEEFSADVAAEAAAIEDAVSPEEFSGRRDRRGFRIVTIDGEDAKDLDDGVYAERRADGSFFLGVYIADVSWYVRENSPLDREARARGTSVYLVDRVIPMLPKKLSNGICSLNAGEDRLAMACEMEIGADGLVKSYEILPVVIHVYRRLTYTLVNEIFAEGADAVRTENADLLPLLTPLREVHDAMEKARHERGSIGFDVPEIKVKLDESGKPVALIKRTGSLAESMIEQCMLAANETVAEHMEKKEQPFLYRVHEQPSDEKIERLNNLLATFSLHLVPNEAGEVAPKDVQQVLEKVKGRPEERIVSAVSLRSMQQARYADAPLGHYGLAARHYTHFTSPIRRYPDLIVHRLLRETFATGTIAAGRQERLRSLLPEIAEHTSARERIAIEAERETQDMKKIEYMAQFVGDAFDAVISGVTAFGIFCELENGVEGLVHVSSMVNDYYEYREDLYALVGGATHVSYRLGEPVRVVLVRANIAERNLDFILEDNGVFVAAKKKPEEGGVKRGESSKGKGAKKDARSKKGRGRKAAKEKRTDEIIADVKGDKHPEKTSAPAETGERKPHGKGHKGAKPHDKGRGAKRPERFQVERQGALADESSSSRPKAFWMKPPKDLRKKGKKSAPKPEKKRRPHNKTQRATANSD
ncbi:ribonuclease R [Selenomonas sputigena]|uniref:ribonuclease R n=1 Tax=Selenomonas sputigena TaxID=69823 RepID=UPI002230935E|nr:ribonuclease R [Selenomonas sputigena]UZD42169.1 ribonuclease R [Selenomonas sputigena]